MNSLLAVDWAADGVGGGGREGNPFYNSTIIAKVVQSTFPQHDTPTLWQWIEHIIRGDSWSRKFGSVYLSKQEQKQIEAILQKQYAPKFVRASLYEYQYTPLYGSKNAGEKGWQIGKWYKRRWVREYMPPISLGNPQIPQFLQHYGLASP